MRPLDDIFAASSSSAKPKLRPSSVSSRSPSPGTRSGTAGHGNAGAGPGGLTFFLTEENNFGVHSISESHLSSQPNPSPAMNTSDSKNIETKTQDLLEEFKLDKPVSDSLYEELSKSVENVERTSSVTVPAAIPPRSFEQPRHMTTPSIGSNVSPTISTPSSPRQNLSSSVISDESELDLESPHDEEPGPADSVSSSFPQLVMPKVNMPRRKAFTEAGRTMGKLKVMVVGDSGIGKSSLIQAILNTSADIVHYDPPQTAPSLSSSSSSSFIKPSLSRRSTLQPNATPPTENILEIKASTRAYPSWWKAETERDSKAGNRPSLPRRESTGEVLERNVIFVDTPGYGSFDDFNNVLARVSGYLEENYDKVNSLLDANANRTADILSLFSNGINCVDLVIYVVLHRLKPVDITIMRHLSTLTNILPVIAKSDTLSHTQTLTLKLSLLRDLRSNSIPIFTFGKSLSELERNVVNGIPWAISCLKDDAVEMDASLLMREENVEQYVESDLPLLNTCLVENASWLRFAATKKFLEWRRGKMSTPLTNLQQSTGLGVSEMSLISLPSEGYAMARVGDHMDREERLARVRLAQWAGDMRREIRRKMQEEREEFERLEHQERVRWLAARLNEAINQTPETSLVTTSTSKSSPIVRPRSSFELSRRRRQHIVDRDPLGLVWVTERWGPRVSQSLVWIVEAGVVLGSGWVVWKYVVDSGLSGWFISSART